MVRFLVWYGRDILTEEDLFLNHRHDNELKHDLGKNNQLIM